MKSLEWSSWIIWIGPKHNHMHSYKRQKEATWHRRGEDSVSTESLWCGQKLRGAGKHWSWKRQGVGSSWQPLERGSSVNTLVLVWWNWLSNHRKPMQKRHSELILTGVLKGVKIAMGCKRMLFNEAALKIIWFLYQRSKVQYLFHCLVHMTSSKKNG